LQDHLKERLTGAAILVIVVVLLVPELFRGPPSTGLNPGTGASAGPPVRSYTIDLRDTATAQPAGASVPATDIPATASSNSANAPSAVPVTSAAGSTLHPAPSPSSGPNTASLAGVSAPAPKSAPTPAAHAAAPARQGTMRSGWTVQVGSFARRDYAEHMAKQVAAKGFAVEVAGPDDRGLFRVRSPAQPERATAVALKQKMQASGLKPIVNTVP
jgi:DedD protein